MARIFVVIVAAGSGTRFGTQIPKQFLLLEHKPVLMHTIDAFNRALPEAHVTVVLSNSFTGYWNELCAKHSFVSPSIAIGGASRAESVGNALKTLPEAAPGDIVLIHDGARPLISAATIRRVVEATEAHGGACIPAIGVTDTLRHATSPTDSHVVDRREYCLVQTPQGFDRQLFEQAYARIGSAGLATLTDDASVYERAFGISPAICEGDPCNIKITNPNDLTVAAALMRAPANG